MTNSELWLNVVPMQLEDGKWTIGQESEIDHEMYPILFAREYGTREEALESILEELDYE